jgi:hypothetical protein
VALVMRDGAQVPWFAAGKGLEGLAWASVPGRELGERLLRDPRLTRPGLRLYLNFCDARALMFGYDETRERLVPEELAGGCLRILWPEPERVPPLPEFFYLWGAGSGAAPGGATKR